jgi:hypothetical protein
MSMAAPEIANFLAMFEVSTWLDVAVATVMTASTLCLRATAAHLRQRIAGTRARASRRRRTRTAPPPSSNDDEPAPQRRAA